MELTQLKYFFAVYEFQSYSKASEKMHVSRQAIAQSIKNLENEFNNELFVVSKNKIFPTKLAIDLYSSCKPLVDQLIQKETELKRALQNNHEIRVGVLNSLLPFFTPELEDNLKKYKETYPNIILNIQTYNGDELFAKYDNKELDAIVTLYMPTDNEHDKINVIQAFPFGITIGVSDPLNEYDSVCLRDLYGLTSTCMDANLRTMGRLKETLQAQNIKINFTVIYKAIDAYSLMDNKGYIMFNGINNTHLLAQDYKDLEIRDFKYSWDLCIIHKHTTNEINELVNFLIKNHN